MPSEKSSRVSVQKAKRNQMVRSAVRTRVSTALKTIESEGTAEAQAAIARAASALDRAAKKGVVHPNNASRRTSRLAKRLNSLTSENNS